MRDRGIEVLAIEEPEATGIMGRFVRVSPALPDEDIGVQAAGSSVAGESAVAFQ